MAASESAGFNVRAHLQAGHVIPAHPLALTPARDMDERHQQALTRYYVAAGAGGMAVGVHTTGFPIHDAKIGLYRPVLELAAATADAALATAPRPFVRVAGLIGDTAQALREAQIALALGYHCGLLSLGAWRDASDDAILAHCRRVADAIPLFGFYLQPAVGGRRLGYAFWREFAEIANVVAIKVAPFDRYATLDVVRALADAGRDDIALYTGNDDAIVADLVTDIPVTSGGRAYTRHFVGGLLGQWAVWTRTAVTMLAEIKALRASGSNAMPREWLTRGAALTMANAVIFDAANGYTGCLPGILDILRRQGLVRGTWTYDTHERLSPGQAEMLARLPVLYPELTDDAFVAEHRDGWLG
ncbi:MAG: dihydrodipicolinate synthase family protein [Gemmatimonas sp.]|jgi:dihydrodipicolinate synthase/N-acetylneuraminate lyase|uniref:dihydrodipicolinate synthase family protein n=2 Tax=Gemmatimonas sp. TaxID=1962908 RepID=UPI0025C3D5C8|nr:dihydrodipicolinate synthase family protein [Gemmatimonas sp.]MCA2985561.1 dihydrodipicolinate synthase family protein [Gemmatimonas sp.]MCA2986363.1 dihydrodipicolinate synthase family protein [Gemmatimonas sp.]MCA2993532.1 dihydrodipicolinate synthase family protein [Gemmatimonas sp.]